MKQISIQPCLYEHSIQHFLWYYSHFSRFNTVTNQEEVVLRTRRSAGFWGRGVTVALYSSSTWCLAFSSNPCIWLMVVSSRIFWNASLQKDSWFVLEVNQQQKRVKRKRMLKNGSTYSTEARLGNLSNSGIYTESLFIIFI